MSLYTSYYTRQLALRPEVLVGQDSTDGVKTKQPAVPRRTVDIVGPYVTWFEERPSRGLNPSQWPEMGVAGPAALGMLPPVALPHQPASGVATTFATQADSRTRSSVNVVCWTPQGRRCLCGTQAGEFTMWDGVSFGFESILQAHDCAVRAMTHTRSGGFLVSGDDTGTVRYWRPNLELVKSGRLHEEAVRALSFAPSDLKFATASDDGTVRVWDFARLTREQALSGHGGDVRTVDWNPREALLASGSKDGLVKLWCARSGKCIATLHGHRATVMQAAWAPNGQWLLSASRDASCRLWEPRMRRELASFRGPGKDVISAAWHPVHEGLFCAGSNEGTLLFWLADRPDQPQGEVAAAHAGPIWTMQWHPAGHLLATGGVDGATKFWCRRRPGDPFFEVQQEAQAAAMGGFEPRPAPRSAAPTVGPTGQLSRGPEIGGRPGSRQAMGRGGPVALPGLGPTSMDGGVPEAAARPELMQAIPGLAIPVPRLRGRAAQRLGQPAGLVPAAAPPPVPGVTTGHVPLEDGGPTKRQRMDETVPEQEGPEVVMEEPDIAPPQEAAAAEEEDAAVGELEHPAAEAWHGESIVLPTYSRTPSSSSRRRSSQGAASQPTSPR